MHRVIVEHLERAGIISVTGEIDAFVAPELEEAFASVEGSVLVVADLARVSFLDSTALGVVVRAAQSRSADRTMRVVLPLGTARRIFEITTLDRVLPVVASRAEALVEV